MSDYTMRRVHPSDRRGNAAVDRLLAGEGIRRDANLDYTCALFDEELNVVATGSCFGNTLRCLAVSHEHQGEGLMNEIVTHLVQFQFERGSHHLFLYTKCSAAKFFRDLGFYEIVRIEGEGNGVVFMENRRTGFADYLKALGESQPTLPSGDASCAVVMNANPFTLGHQYLVERASAENDAVHLFVLSEDASLVPFSVRKRLVLEGTRHLGNVAVHDSGPYIISGATFPSYFQRDETAVIESHARLDLAVFVKIAAALGIRARYVGEEPRSLVTGIYNQIMAEELPEHGIRCEIISRKETGGEVISASTVRQTIKAGDRERLRALVPQSTYDYFTSGEARPVIERIRAEDNVVHY
ncbi:MAG: [citrate (pro-3S)-lyase] ligase [Fretibacterium sp.]|nr:[citrate (pro-3S)-lyase] ligase [Fretibacterium sp.]